MASRPSPTPTVSNTVRLSFGDVAVAAQISVPGGAVDGTAVLPALQGLVNEVVEACERREVAAGRPISCRKGCGACCRQLVPIAPVEARAIAAMVGRLPPARGAEIRRRFDDAARRLQLAGLTEALLRPQARNDADRELGRRYFALGLACPFLEDEACSIHADRPLACREYLVTSPAANCADPLEREIASVPVPKLSAACRGLERDDPRSNSSRNWLPLALALAWVKTAPAAGRKRSGPEWIQRFFARLSLPPEAKAP